MSIPVGKKWEFPFPTSTFSFMYSWTEASALDRWDSMDGVGL